MQKRTFVLSKGRKLEIYPDPNPSSPREDSTLGTMVCFHRRYNLGDKHEFKSTDFNNWCELEKTLKKDHDAALVIPLYLYDHSGITMNTTGFSCPWDSGQVGFIYVDRDTLRREYGVKRITKAILERAKSALLAEVKAYDQYLNGDIYGFVLKDKDEEIDSCWGFYGNDPVENGMIDHFDTELQHEINKLTEKRQNEWYRSTNTELQH